MDVSAYCPRGSSERITAWLKFALYEAFLFTPLHPELLNFKLLRRPQSLAQELPGLEGESIAMTQAPLRKSSLLSKRAGEYLLSWTWWEQALLCRPLETSLLLLPLAGFASRIQHLPASGGYFCLPAGSGLPSAVEH